jgi:Mg2+-importing ATPase
MKQYPNETGLDHREAQKLLQEFGPNAVSLEKKANLFEQFLMMFKSPLIILLLVSSAISAGFGEVESFIIILFIVLLSMTLDLFNSYKSDKAAQDLKNQIRVTATVIREGHEQEIRIEQLVPGDLVILRVGDIIPADGKVMEAEHCFVNEASLTGESFPQEKEINGDLFMGSSVTTGEALMKVTQTGSRTHFNHIISNLSKAGSETEFDRELKGFSMLVLKITMGLVVAVFLINAVLKGNYLESLLFAVALAVGMTPEMMPMIITINLSKGSLAMAKHGVIVKRLSAIQNFGSMDILCTDKTGTLTEDHIALVQYLDAYGQTSEETLRYGFYNSALTSGFKNPLDDAVQQFRHLKLSGVKKLAEIPFDFVRRRESIVVREEDKNILITKGAPEEVLKICHLDTKIEQAALDTYNRLSKTGFRVLAIAKAEVETKKKYGVEDEKSMTFLGVLAFLDPPKESVAKTLKNMQKYSIGIKIITGDNELVSQHIAEAVGLTITGVLLGTQIDKMTDEQLFHKMQGVNLFARVNPDQKLRIIKTLQARGHVIGYIGDGINDAPSLKAADVGISVNNGTDIAKESADLIMIRKNLDDLILAVIEGRKTFMNTTKYLMMALSSNFGNMFSMAGASLILPFLPMLPTQVLLNNLLYDSSQFTLPVDHVDDQDLRYPKRLNIGILRKFMFVFGPVSSVFDFLTFGLLYFWLHLSQAQFQAGWFIESLATQVFVIYIIRTKLLPFIQSRPSKYLVGSTVFMVALGWAIALSFAGKFVGFQPIGWFPILMIGIMVVIYLVLVEIVKKWFWRYWINQDSIKEM